MGQVKICLRRGFWRLQADPSLTLFQLFGNFVMALIVSSVFYNLPAVCRERAATSIIKLTYVLSRRTLRVSIPVVLYSSSPSCSMPLVPPWKF